MNRWAEESLRDSRPDVFWNETVGDVPDAEVLIGDLSADLVIIGGGFSGLWAAVQAIEDNASRQIVVLESERVGFGASSRNGGFCTPSLTHGVLNGESHWPEENAQLVALGDANLDALEATIRDHHIDCDFQRVGGMDAAVEPWQLEQMEDALPTFKRFSDDVVLLDGEEARGIVNSPTYLGAIYGPGGSALVNPAQLAWGLRRVAEAAGVRIFENSPASGLTQHGAGVQVRTEKGSIVAPKAIVATNAYGTPLSRVKRYIIPVYDHVLMTEPLTTDQLGSIGWSGREGVDDWANQFHYYRLSDDNRILWGGYDATYHFNNGVKPQHDQRSETHEKLADHFFTTFPQLEGL